MFHCRIGGVKLTRFNFILSIFGACMPLIDRTVGERQEMCRQREAEEGELNWGPLQRVLWPLYMERLLSLVTYVCDAGFSF